MCHGITTCLGSYVYHHVTWHWIWPAVGAFDVSCDQDTRWFIPKHHVQSVMYCCSSCGRSYWPYLMSFFAWRSCLSMLCTCTESPFCTYVRTYVHVYSAVEHNSTHKQHTSTSSQGSEENSPATSHSRHPAKLQSATKQLTSLSRASCSVCTDFLRALS